MAGRGVEREKRRGVGESCGEEVGRVAGRGVEREKRRRGEVNRNATIKNLSLLFSQTTMYKTDTCTMAEELSAPTISYNTIKLKDYNRK